MTLCCLMLFINPSDSDLMLSMTLTICLHSFASRFKDKDVIFGIAKPKSVNKMFWCFNLACYDTILIWYCAVCSDTEVCFLYLDSSSETNVSCPETRRKQWDCSHRRIVKHESNAQTSTHANESRWVTPTIHSCDSPTLQFFCRRPQLTLSDVLHSKIVSIRCKPYVNELSISFNCWETFELMYKIRYVYCF